MPVLPSSIRHTPCNRENKMPTIKLTDQFGLDADVKLAPFSSLLKYFQQLPALQLTNGDLSKVAGLTLDQPALTILNTGVSFDQSVPIGDRPPSLFLPARTVRSS